MIGEVLRRDGASSTVKIRVLAGFNAAGAPGEFERRRPFRVSAVSASSIDMPMYSTARRR
jgi:hypothetical protein